MKQIKHSFNVSIENMDIILYDDKFMDYLIGNNFFYHINIVPKFKIKKIKKKIGLTSEYEDINIKYNPYYLTNKITSDILCKTMDKYINKFSLYGRSTFVLKLNDLFDLLNNYSKVSVIFVGYKFKTNILDHYKNDFLKLGSKLNFDINFNEIILGTTKFNNKLINYKSTDTFLINFLGAFSKNVELYQETLLEIFKMIDNIKIGASFIILEVRLDYRLKLLSDFLYVSKTYFEKVSLYYSKYPLYSKKINIILGNKLRKTNYSELFDDVELDEILNSRINENLVELFQKIYKHNSDRQSVITSLHRLRRTKNNYYKLIKNKINIYQNKYNEQYYKL